MPNASDPAVQLLRGWGNYPPEPCRVSRPETLAIQQAVLAGDSSRDYIPRGLGRAYGDSALNHDGGVVVQTRLNRFLDFDAEQGLVNCLAGVALEEIIEALLPRGWFLPTTPGTKFVTVGGAIAADVHGKNHHLDGSFGNFVLDFDLLIASGEVLTCSPTSHEQLFWATIGGMGLTGTILRARVRLLKVESAYLNVSYRRTRDLDATLECFAATNEAFRYSVAWVDCLASGGSLGRCVVMLANDAPRSALSTRLQGRPLVLPSRRNPSVPFHFPSFALNSWSVRIFNELYYRMHGDCERVVDRNAYFYPLDHVLHWNRIYGRRGFIQYQVLFPPETSHRALTRLLEKVARSRQASFLAVLKTMGPANPGLLSFPHAGHTLTLDIPNSGEDLRRLVRELDALVLDHGGRLYLAKDAMTTPEAFRAMYPRLSEFQQIKAQVDPNNRFSSSQARRLGIVEAR